MRDSTILPEVESRCQAKYRYLRASGYQDLFGERRWGSSQNLSSSYLLHGPGCREGRSGAWR